MKAFVLAAFAAALSAEAAAEPRTDIATRAHSLDVLERRIDHYVDQSKKAAIVARLREKREALLAIEDNDAFLKALNADLFEASGDKHLLVFMPGANPPAADDPSLGTHGVGKVERLAGGTAYVELTSFGNSPESAAAIDAALAKVAGAPALIIDLRNNLGGGEASFLRLLGHLFPTRTEITAIEWRQCAPPPPERPDACTQIEPRLERRYAAQVEKPLFPTQPVYVLTSKGSFSAAEAIAYELQAQGRATIIGERTGGGGNPSAGMDLESDYVIIMPIGRMRPVRGNGWEGVGVRPDVEVGADKALEAALTTVKG